MIGKLGILITILFLVFLFFIVISLGAGAFSKKEKKPEIKKYLKSIYFLLVIIALLTYLLLKNEKVLGIKTETQDYKDLI